MKTVYLYQNSVGQTPKSKYTVGLQSRSAMWLYHRVSIILMHSLPSPGIYTYLSTFKSVEEKDYIHRVLDKIIDTLMHSMAKSGLSQQQQHRRLAQLLLMLSHIRHMRWVNRQLAFQALHQLIQNVVPMILHNPMCFSDFTALQWMLTSRQMLMTLNEICGCWNPLSCIGKCWWSPIFTCVCNLGK